MHALIATKALPSPLRKPRAYTIVPAQSISAGKNQTTDSIGINHEGWVPQVWILRPGRGKKQIEREREQAYPCTILSTTSPSEFTNSTFSGIFPYAWVEQLRQGSNVRTTA